MYDYRKMFYSVAEPKKIGDKKMETVFEQDLQEWANANEPAENLLWGDGYWHQIIFMRDTIPSILFPSYKEAQKYKPIVISTHTSKSIRLPVYQQELKNGIKLTMRYNFYNWKISVDSPIDIEVDFLGLFDPEEKDNIQSIFCEGFPQNAVYGCYAENRRQFTVELSSDYKVFTFLWILSEEFGLRKKP